MSPVLVSSKRENWRTRWARVWHRWLKNIYLKKLNRWKCKLEKPAGIVSHQKRSPLAQELLGWEEYRSDIEALLEDFVVHMSPAALFETEPLSRCSEQTTAWLRRLTHLLWLARLGSFELEKAKRQFAEADGAYRDLQDCLTHCDDIESMSALDEWRDKFMRFHEACSDLSLRIRALPVNEFVV